MLKYLAPLLLCLPCVAQRAKATVPVTGAQVEEFQRMKATLDTPKLAVPGDMEERMRQQQITSLMLERQEQLRRSDP